MNDSLYFAYGSNLDVAQMARRCPGAQPNGAAMLMDHELTFPRTADDWDRGGVAGVEANPGAVADGGVYAVSAAHMRSLDRYEAVAEGHYRRAWQTVMVAGKGPTKAWVYHAEPEAGGPFAPSARYAAALLRGAERFGLDVLARKMRRAMRGDDRPTWDVAALGAPPTVEPAGLDELDTESIFIEALPWRGKATKTFAFIGMPDRVDAPVPGVVLVHGGGGSAFPEWVRLWNARGYAAIAVDCNGGYGAGKDHDRPRHEHAGPPGWGGFDTLDEPVEDQWPYHAVANVMLAHSALAARPQVDAERIGLTGISWGGFQASLTAGVDHRFKWCAPVYGCAFPAKWTLWRRHPHIDDATRLRWSAMWDPARWLVDARCAMRWVSSPHDFAFQPTQIDHSTQVPARRASMTLGVNWAHGHAPGWAPREIEAFANQHTRGGAPLLRIDEQHVEADRLTVRCGGQKIARAELCIADDRGPWIDTGWRTEPAAVDHNSSGDTATAPLPESFGGAYLNVYDERGLITSGRVVLPPDELAAD